MYKISVIYLNYNQEKYIKTSLEAILNQTYKPFEIIVIDDCSSDNSVKILQKYAKENDNIKLFLNKVNKGAAWVSNHGLENSQGDLIYIAAADDFVEKDLLKEANLSFSLNKNIGMFSARINIINKDGKYIHNNLTEHNSILIPIKESYKKIIRNNYWVTGQTVIYKKNLLIKHKLKSYENLKLYMDHLTIYNIIFRYDCFFSNKILATWRLLENSYSDKNFKINNSLPALHNFKIKLQQTLPKNKKNTNMIKIIINNYKNNLEILHLKHKIAEINQTLKFGNIKNIFYLCLLNISKILLHLNIFIFKINKKFRSNINSLLN